MENTTNAILFLELKGGRKNKAQIKVRDSNSVVKALILSNKKESTKNKLKYIFSETGEWLEEQIRKKLKYTSFEFDSYLAEFGKVCRITICKQGKRKLVMVITPQIMAQNLENIEKVERKNQNYLCACYPKKEKASHFQEIKVDGEDKEGLKENSENEDAVITSVLTSMSHQTRTPLNGIIGFAEFIKYKFSSEEATEAYLEHIINSGYRLLDVINNMLYLVRIETGQLKINKSQYFLNQVLDEIYWEFHYQNKYPKSKKVELKINYPLPEGEDQIIINKHNLQEVLRRLLDNALKYTSEGWVELSYEVKTSKELIFYVKDTGKGISQDRQDELFDISKQLEKKIHGEPDGTGLGLNIARKLINLMGGGFGFDSEEGKGSCFCFSMPFEYSRSKFLINEEQ